MLEMSDGIQNKATVNKTQAKEKEGKVMKG